MDEKTYDDFWKEFSTNIKLGVMEDPVSYKLNQSF